MPSESTRTEILNFCTLLRQMPKIITPPKPGRPPRNLIDVLRTQLWFHVLKLWSGLPSSYAIEKELEPHLVLVSEDKIVRPRKWDSYERGTRVPKRKFDESDAVELAERHFPGTAQWFDNPIWDILKGASPDQWALQSLLQKLSPEVTEVLITTDTPMGKGRPELVDLTPDHFDRLVMIGNFHALAATVLLAKLSEVTASPELREMVLNCYARLQPVLADTPEVGVHYPELFTYVDKVCQYWVVLSPGKRLNMHLFWHSHTWAKDRRPYIQKRLRLLYRAHEWGDGWEEQP